MKRSFGSAREESKCTRFSLLLQIAYLRISAKKIETVRWRWAAGVVTAIRYVALLSLLGGTATVITGVILMTPETANGRGALPVVADGR